MSTQKAQKGPFFCAFCELKSFTKPHNAGACLRKPSNPFVSYTGSNTHESLHYLTNFVMKRMISVDGKSGQLMTLIQEANSSGARQECARANEILIAPLQRRY